MKKDIHQQVTNSLIKCLERGVRPWTDGLRVDFKGYPNNPFTGKNYRGINVVILWTEMNDKKYSSHKWATLNQITKAGGTLKKGQEATEIVLFRPFIPEGKKDKILLARFYQVYNLTQTKGLTHIINKKPRTLSKEARIAKVETFIKHCGAYIRHSRTHCTPCYNHSTDDIKMPSFKLYKSAPEYYSVLMHEHIHWTGAKKRLNRARSVNTIFGYSKEYAFEELIAEIGSASMNAQMQIPSNIENQASYISSWLTLLRNDKKAIFKAAAAASRACTFLKDLQPKKTKKKAKPEAVVQYSTYA